MTKKRIGFSMGDPTGIGPHITLEAIDYFLKKDKFVPIVFGSKSLLNHPFLKKKYNHLPIQDYQNDQFEPQTMYIVDCGDFPLDFKSEPSVLGGKRSADYIEQACKFALDGKIDAIVTAPISKTSLEMASVPFTGHTTMLKALTGSSQVNMAFYSPKLNVVLATIHIPLKSVSEHLSESLLKQAIDASLLFMKSLGKASPQIAVAGLNPHASEDGLFGDEERTIIQPVIETYQKNGVSIDGPFPGDTVFLRAVQGEFDCVVAMYHDQGLIPVKLLGFESAVNITLGLPFTRTSPDHGTAFDIAYTDNVSAQSMIKSISSALTLKHYAS
jgi:4-hydroxythreonine-4-phosphate dehydrogenase